MNQCCVGQGSAFCPSCGSKLGHAQHIKELRQHCEAHLMQIRAMQEACAARPDEGHEARKARRVAQLGRTQAKWQRWVDALNKVLDTGDVDRRLEKE